VGFTLADHQNSPKSFSITGACPACGQRNRIPAGHLADRGRCGACKRALPAHSEPINVDEVSFAEIVTTETVAIFADFWAPWCGPCLIAAANMKRLALEATGNALILKINTDECPQLAEKFGVETIPQFVLLRGGHRVFQHAGLVPYPEMRRWIEEPITSIPVRQDTSVPHNKADEGSASL
jgi:thioredoxin 2